MQNWYYTKNGEKQGPISLELLQGMAYRGALNPQKDMVWTEGMTDWKLSGEVDSLKSDDSAQSTASFNPYAAPLTPAHELLAPISVNGLGEIEPGSVSLDAMTIAKRAFELTKRHFGTLLGISIVYLVITLGAEFGISAIEASMGWSNVGVLPGGIGADLPGAATQHSIVGMILSTLFSTFLGLGLNRSCLNIASGDEANIGILFSQGTKLINTLLASLLYGLIVCAGLLLLIVPGIIFALRYSMFQEAIIDRNLGVIESLKYSAKLTQNNRLNLFALGVLSVLIVLAGFLALFVGVFFAFPMLMVMTPLTYRFLQYGPRALTDQPGTQTPTLSGVCPKN